MVHNAVVYPLIHKKQLRFTGEYVWEKCHVWYIAIYQAWIYLTKKASLTHWEALFLFCWAKVLGPTIFGSDNLKLLVFELLLALLSEQLLAHLLAPNRRAKIHPNINIFTMLGAKNCRPNHFVPTIGEKVYCTHLYVFQVFVTFRRWQKQKHLNQSELAILGNTTPGALNMNMTQMTTGDVISDTMRWLCIILHLPAAWELMKKVLLILNWGTALYYKHKVCIQSSRYLRKRCYHWQVFFIIVDNKYNISLLS